MEEDLLATVFLRSLHMEGCFITGLEAHLAVYPDETFPIVKKLYEAGKRDTRPNPYLLYLNWIPGIVLDRYPQHSLREEIHEFIVRAVEESQEYYNKHPRIPGLHRKIIAPRAQNINVVAELEFARHGTARTAWFENWLTRRIKAARSRNDREFFKFLISTVLPAVGVERKSPKVALQMLGIILDADEKILTGSTGTMVISALARIALAYPDEVKQFMAEQDLPEAVRVEASTQRPPESVGDLIRGINALAFLVDAVIESASLRKAIIDVLRQPLEVNDMRAWANFIFREAVGIVAGEEVLDLPGNDRDKDEDKA